MFVCWGVNEEQGADVCRGMPVSDRVDWDFGGLATDRHKQPVSPVSCDASLLVCRPRDATHPESDGRPSPRAEANSKDGHITTCNVSDELMVFNESGCKTFLTN